MAAEPKVPSPPTGRPRPILYVHHRSELGGSPTSLSYLIRHLDRDRFEPHVFCPPGRAAQLFRESGALVHTGPVSGFTHIWASTYRGLRWLLLGRELASLPGHLRALRRVLSAHDFALVHLNDSPLIPAALAAGLAGIPVVWHLRSALPTRDGPRRTRYVRRYVARHAAASIAINDDVSESFGAAAITIPNAVDLTRFRPGDTDEAKRALGLDPARVVIAFFGFIYPSKGFHDFIRAAALLRARGVDATYLIVGGAVRGRDFFETTFGWSLRRLGLARDHEADAHELVARLGLQGDVSFVSFTPDTSLHYQASEIVVAPSRGPELGRPVLEGAASGCPVVASGSLSGAGILVPDVTGYLVPQRSPDALGGALHELVNDAGLRRRLALSARRHAEREFDAESNTRRIMEIYDSILAGR